MNPSPKQYNPPETLPKSNKFYPKNRTESS